MSENFLSDRPSILHLGKFYPPDSGGIETHVRDLAVRQARTNRVKVIVANAGARYEIEKIDGVQVERLAHFGTIASMPVCPGLPAAIRRSPADLVHIHTPNPGAALALLMSGQNGKIVITHHADTLGRRILRQFSDPFVHRVMRRASRIIVTSARYLESSPELAPFRDKCCIVPLGIDLQDIACRNNETISKFRQKFGERFILAVGRLVPYKGFNILVRAMKNVDARLVLVGAGPEYDPLAKLAASEGVTERVIMPGRVEDIRPYFAAASIFVLPSLTRAEAFGMVQLEAMAAGLPVVNTDIDSGVPEVCLDGKTGITVPPGDATALSRAMQLLLERNDLREQFGEAARVRVNTEYTADVMAARTWSVYAEVCNRWRDVPVTFE
ncbi:glycosyltransferase [Paracidobacterium acidisoli]|uniref:Glycosyltransferase n=1 Tax=Paracidobacterium acidisoli TaxID=2303751 RepID=A0A372IQ91_9BACT|nr:glycosyltransferase [Paracidobacterium acidisoli]MBT9331245.1 glycosyltransferase [Paracidobacterium acidisoli]